MSLVNLLLYALFFYDNRGDLIRKTIQLSLREKKKYAPCPITIKEQPEQARQKAELDCERAQASK
jgi:hypothetical protein